MGYSRSMTPYMIEKRTRPIVGLDILPKSNVSPDFRTWSGLLPASFLLGRVHQKPHFLWPAFAAMGIKTSSNFLMRRLISRAVFGCCGLLKRLCEIFRRMAASA